MGTFSSQLLFSYNQFSSLFAYFLTFWNMFHIFPLSVHWNQSFLQGVLASLSEELSFTNRDLGLYVFFAPGVLLLPGPQWRELGNTCRYVHLYTYTLIVCVYLPSVYQPLHLPTHLHTCLRQNHEFTEIASISVRRHRFIFIFFLYL